MGFPVATLLLLRAIMPRNNATVGIKYTRTSLRKLQNRTTVLPLLIFLRTFPSLVLTEIV
jgi:hypothetical protein